ncbi:MAG: rod-binding protein [Syntrophomonadaceae bacterium]|jgi:flagellar protein FlgJ
MNITFASSNNVINPMTYQPEKEAHQVKKFTTALENASKQKDLARLKESCQQLEGVFLNKLIEAMRSTVPKSDLISHSFATDVFESMLFEEYAKSMSQTDSIGIGDIIYKQLSQTLD